MSVAVAVKDYVHDLGGAFMLSREAREFGNELGLEGFLGPYTRGRGGVLGDVDADVIAASFGFFPLAAVRLGWESSNVPAAQAAAGYAHACQDFGRRKLAGFAGADRLAELLRAVVAAADPVAVPLFAGWRAMSLPADGPAQVLQLTHVLRELRGGLHVLAIKASGLSPLHAVLIKGSPLEDGVGQARRYGWPEPYPEIAPAQLEQWTRAEAITDELAAPAFAVLEPAAAAELQELLAHAHAQVFQRPAR